MADKLVLVIGLIQKNQAATLAALSSAFAEDFGHFARSNNREPLNRASLLLGKAKADKAIALAIHAGYKAGGLAVGYSGAQSGKFKDQPESFRATYEAAIEAAEKGFTDSLTESGVFVDAAPKTDAEKAKVKEDKAIKAKEVLDNHVNALIVNGELVRVCDVRSELSTSAMIESVIVALEANMVNDDDRTALLSALGYTVPTMQNVVLELTS